MSEQSWKNSWGSAAQSFLAQTERQWGLASEQRNSKPTKELMQTSSDEFCNSPVATTAFFSNIIITKLDFFQRKAISLILILVRESATPLGFCWIVSDGKSQTL